jgi:predicted dehydrogenase
VWLDHKAESGGGIVLHTGVHSFDLLYFLTGCEVDEVWCQTSQVVTHETEDNFVMMCNLREPLLKGVVIGSRSTHSRSGLIELSGEKGQLVGDHAHGFAYLIKGSTRIELPVAPPCVDCTRHGAGVCGEHTNDAASHHGKRWRTRGSKLSRRRVIDQLAREIESQ